MARMLRKRLLRQPRTVTFPKVKSWGKVRDQKTRKMGDGVWGGLGNGKKRVLGLKRRGDEGQLGGFLPSGHGEGEWCERKDRT